HGLIGQETTGVGGMAKALRTIPILLEIASDMRELAPGALLVNFTNPAGLVTEALSRYAPDIPAVGVCNVPITTKMRLLALLEEAGSLMPQPGEPIAPERAALKTLGLNHLSWHYGFTLDGEDVWPGLFQAYLSRLKAAPNPEWDVDTIEALGSIPNYYLQYYYHTDRKLAAQEDWPPSRADEVQVIEARLLQYYADPTNTDPHADLMKRGGAYYATLATQLLNAHYNDLGEPHVVNVPHSGAVPGWPTDWVLEMPCRVGRAGIQPLPVEPLPPACWGLLAQVKAYELLTVEAAVHGKRRAAYQALLAHPLGPTADRVTAVLNDLLLTHRAHLPQFWS
ncbi:MAG: 6-phospho-beta-glucosidase, partial [Ardenticatenaceae bacterium]